MPSQDGPSLLDLELRLHQDATVSPEDPALESDHVDDHPVEADHFNDMPDLEIVQEHESLETLLLPSPLSLPSLETVSSTSIEGFSPSVAAESPYMLLPPGNPHAVVDQQEAFEALYWRFVDCLSGVDNTEKYIPLLEESMEYCPSLAMTLPEESDWGSPVVVVTQGKL